MSEKFGEVSVKICVVLGVITFVNLIAGIIGMIWYDTAAIWLCSLVWLCVMAGIAIVNLGRLIGRQP